MGYQVPFFLHLGYWYFSPGMVIYVHQGQIFVPGPGSNICPRVITMYLVLSQDPVMRCQGSRRIFLVPFMPQFLVSFDILLTDVRPNICSHICLILLLIF